MILHIQHFRQLVADRVKQSAAAAARSDKPKRTGSQDDAQASSKKDRSANPFGAAFKPGLPPLGVREHVVRPGDTVLSILQDGKKGRQLDSKNWMDALGATPFLDRKAFGKRPANGPEAVNNLKPGQVVNVLDETRLEYLDEQRKLLAAVDPKASSSRHKDQMGALTVKIFEELDYAGTQQAAPDATQLAQVIRNRAASDPTFNQAVDAAIALYEGNLKKQGRTRDQIGVLQRHAESGDFAAVSESAKQQLLAVVDGKGGADALGRITARGSVYMTYAGGDPRFAEAVEKGIRAARDEVLVKRPAKAVADAYRKDGAAGAMEMLKQVTDPEKHTPGQVGQIMNDPVVQGILKKSVDDVAKWDYSRGGPIEVMMDLAQACQNSAYSDLGTPGLGKQAVDQVASYIMSELNKPETTAGAFQAPGVAQQVFSDISSEGNVALPLALAAKARHGSNSGYASGVVDGVRMGLDNFSKRIKDKNKQAAEEATFLSVPNKEWGGISTSREELASMQKLIAANPDKAAKLDKTGKELQEMQERHASVRIAMVSYSGDLKGLEGFDKDVKPDYDGYQWSASKSKNVQAALAGIPKAGNPDAPAHNSTPTNTIWFQRSLRKVVEIIGKSQIASLSDKGIANPLSEKGVKITQEVWARSNKTLGAVLYFQNGAYALGEFGKSMAKGSLVNSAVGGVSVIRHELAGVSYALSAGIPPNALPGIRPGSGETAMARTHQRLLDRVAGLDVGDGTKHAMRIGLHLAMQDTADSAAMILGAVSASIEFHKGEYWKGTGQTLNAVGYLALLTGPGIDASELPVGATVLRLGGAAWTGIGAALVLAGSIIYTVADAHSRSHKHDGDSTRLLESMGVRPEVAKAMAVHATSFDADAPTAGPFLTAYFAHNKLSQDDMVKWMNSLTPKQADEIASGIKSFSDAWKKNSMAESARAFDDALLQYGVAPPDIAGDMQLAGAGTTQARVREKGRLRA
jgi:hypothetical protein